MKYFTRKDINNLGLWRDNHGTIEIHLGYGKWIKSSGKIGHLLKRISRKEAQKMEPIAFCR